MKEQAPLWVTGPRDALAFRSTAVLLATTLQPAALHLLSSLPQMDFQQRVSKSRDGRNRNGELGGAELSHAASFLGITESVTAQEHLLPRFEGWHPEVGAAGTAESVAQVAVSTSRLGLGAHLVP